MQPIFQVSGKTVLDKDRLKMCVKGSARLWAFSRYNQYGRPSGPTVVFFNFDV